MDSRSSLWARKWPWIGLWACGSLLFAILYPWVYFFHVPAMLPFPSPGTPRFLAATLGPSLIASLITFSLWRKRYSLAAHGDSRPLTKRDRLVAVVCGCLLMALAIFKIVGFRRVTPYWPGVIGGLILIPLLFLAAMRCAWAGIEALKGSLHEMPPGYQVEPARKSAFEDAPWRRPPRNDYRAVATMTEVIYRKPLIMSIGPGIFAVIMGATTLACLYFAAGSLGVIAIPTISQDVTMGLLLLFGFLMSGALTFVCLVYSGPLKLRISPADHTYTLTLSAPLSEPIRRWFSALKMAGSSAVGLPWRVERRSGPCSDMAGVALQQYVYTNSGNWYAVMLFWRSEGLDPVILAWDGREDRSRFFLRQASEDLAVSVLPDQPAIRST